MRKILWLWLCPPTSHIEICVNITYIYYVNCVPITDHLLCDGWPGICGCQGSILSWQLWWVYTVETGEIKFTSIKHIYHIYIYSYIVLYIVIYIYTVNALNHLKHILICTSVHWWGKNLTCGWKGPNISCYMDFLANAYRYHHVMIVSNKRNQIWCLVAAN